MKHSFLDKYSDRDSVIHRLDPRTKFIVTVLFILAVVLMLQAAWLGFICYLAILALITICSRVPVFYILKRSLLILPFVGIVAISVPFIKQGEIIWSINIWSWTISVTRDGLEVFFTILAKACLSAVSLVLLVSTTKVVDLLKGLEQLRVPNILIMIISFMYRYIFVLTDDIMRMKQARDSRNFGGSRKWQIKTLGNIIGTLFVRSYERGERVYSAMLSRGYDGHTRTLRVFKFNTADFVFGIGISILLVLSGIWGILLR